MNIQKKKIRKKCEEPEIVVEPNKVYANHQMLTNQEVRIEKTWRDEEHLEYLSPNVNMNSHKRKVQIEKTWGDEEHSNCFEKKMNKNYRKRRKKKCKKMWDNAITLDEFYAIKERKVKNRQDEYLFNDIEQNNVNEEIDPITHERNNFDRSEPRERISKIGDCECERRATYHHFNVDEPSPAADTDVMTKNHNGRQTQVVESTKDLIDGTLA
jgi:hypothetical protein